MQYTKAMKALIAPAPTAVLGDFRILLGNENLYDLSNNAVLALINNPPSCEDVLRTTFFNSNGEDAAAGFKCDGCGTGTPPPEWIIDRLEIRNEDNAEGVRPFSNLPARLTLYGSGGGNYNPIFGDANGSQEGSIGNCYIATDILPVNCFEGLGFVEIWHSLYCETTEQLGSGISPN